MTQTWWPIVFELAIVVAFAVGWMILEWQGRRLDRQRDARELQEQQNLLSKDSSDD